MFHSLIQLIQTGIQFEASFEGCSDPKRALLTSVLHLSQPFHLFPAYVWPWQLEDKASSIGQNFRNHNDRITLKLCHFRFSDKMKSDRTTHKLYTKVGACVYIYTRGHFLVKWFN